jgi:hypothetical protein
MIHAALNWRISSMRRFSLYGNWVLTEWVSSYFTLHVKYIRIEQRRERLTSISQIPIMWLNQSRSH